MTNRSAAHAEVFQALRPELIALAYRMLGDLARAEDIMQEAWLRWQRADVTAEAPKAYLSTIVTRLCLNELDSARARREDSRSDRLPEPVDLAAGGFAQLERLERISMAFLVVLQRLKPVERAVFLLHEVFDFDHAQIASLVGKSEAACRKLLERARHEVALGRRSLSASHAEHQRLLHAFVRAASAGDVEGLVAMLAEDAELISDGGPNGRTVGGVRNLTQPLLGAARIASFVIATSARAADLDVREHELNGQPAMVFWRGQEPFAALLLAVEGGKISRVFFHADLARLGHLGARENH
jgi:RNA polymerase sigma-70 factor (ECF subfamily)